MCEPAHKLQPTAQTPHKLIRARPSYDLLLMSLPSQKPCQLTRRGWYACGRPMPLSLKQHLTCALGPLSAQARCVIHALPSTWMP